MKTKRCSKCKTSKPVTEFSPNGKDQYGKPKLRAACKECEREREKTRDHTTKPSYIKKRQEAAERLAKAQALKETRAMVKIQKPKGDFVIDKVSGCFESTHCLQNGYPMISNGDGRTVYHHRSVASVYADIDGMHVHHKCRNRKCVNPAHLQVVTPEEHTAIHKEEDHEEARERDLKALLAVAAEYPLGNRKVLAERTGIPYQRVCYLLKDAGIEVSQGHTKHNAKVDILIRDTMAKHPEANRTALAAITGISNQAIGRWAKANNVMISRKHTR